MFYMWFIAGAADSKQRAAGAAALLGGHAGELLQAPSGHRRSCLLLPTPVGQCPGVLAFIEDRVQGHEAGECAAQQQTCCRRTPSSGSL